MNCPRKTLEIAIVGNGAAAAEAVLSMRAAGYQGEIDLFTDNPYPPYNPMLGTYYLSGAVAAEQCFPFGDESFYDRNRVRARLGSVVTELDPEARSLATEDGTRYQYRLCLVATGARTTCPPLPGLIPDGDGSRVFGLRSFDDAVRLSDALGRAIHGAAEQDRKPRGMVLGASFAGIKVADVLRQAGMDVLIVEREPFILPLSAHPDCATVMQEHLMEKGFDVRVGASLCSVESSSDSLVAHFSGPDEVEEADLLVVCTGSRPNLSFLEPGRVETDVGLVVDEHLETSAPGLYAAGDVAQALNPLTGRHEVLALWANARRQGHVAGLNMVGVHAEYSGSIPCNITHVGDLMFAGIGCMKEYDELETMPEDGGSTTWAFRNGRLAGFNTLGRALSPGIILSALARGAERCRTGPCCGLDDWMREITWMTLQS